MIYTRLITLAAVTMLSCFSFSAQATEDAPPDTFKSWKAMKDYTASRVDSMAVSWLEVERLCEGLKSKTDETAYNKCAYAKAVDQATFANDQSQCTTLAAGTYPDGLLKGRTDTLTETDEHNKVHTYKRTIEGISTTDLKQKRDSAVVACMQKAGWVDTRNWRLGKNNSCK